MKIRNRIREIMRGRGTIAPNNSNEDGDVTRLMVEQETRPSVEMYCVERIRPTLHASLVALQGKRTHIFATSSVTS